jgi:hypothetical protein
MGVVVVLGGIWEIVSFRADRAGPVGSREGRPGGNAGLRGGKPEVCGAVASGMRFQRGAARWPYGYEMITLLEHIGELWQWKAVNGH